MTPEDRDYLSELDALDDAPEAEEPAVGMSGTARALETDGVFKSLTEQLAHDRETEKGKGIFGSFFDAVANTVTGMRNDPALRSLALTPIEGAITVANSPIGPGEASKGLARGYVNVRGSLASGVEQFATSAGFDGLAESAGEQAKGMRDIAMSNALKARVESLGKISKEDWFKDTIDYGLSAVGEGIGSSIAFGAAGVVGGLPGVLALGYTSSLGELREELKEAGITDEAQVAKYAYLAAIPHSILDTLTERGVMKGLTAPAKKEVRRGILRLIMGGAVREGVTEASQRVIELAATAHANGGEAPNAAVIASLFADVEKGADSTILESGVRGALPGAVFGGGQAAAQEARVRTRGTTTDVEPGAAATQEAAPPDSRVIDLDGYSPVPVQREQNAPQGGTGAQPVTTTATPLETVEAVSESTAGQETYVPTGVAASEVPKAHRSPSEIFRSLPPGQRTKEAIFPGPVIGAIRQSPHVNGLEFQETTDVSDYSYPNAPLFDVLLDGVKVGDVAISEAANAVGVMPHVAEKYRRQGIATAVHDAVEAYAVSHGKALLRPKEDSLTTDGKAFWAARGATSGAVAEAEQTVQSGAPSGTLAGLVEASAPVNRKAKLAAMAEAAGLALPDEVFSRPLKDIKAEIARSVEAASVPQATGTETAEDTVEAQPDLNAKFRDVLASNAKVLDWPKLVGATPEEMNTLVDQAVADGLLKVSKAGKISKVRAKEKPSRLGERLSDVMQRGKSEAVERLVSQASPLSIAPDVRIDRAVEVRERQTGKAVPTVVAEYANRIEEARGTPEFQPIIDEIKADRLMKKSDVHDLAHLVGYPVSKSTTKQDALATVVKRHQELLASGVMPGRLAALAAVSEDMAIGQSNRRILDALGFYSQLDEVLSSLKPTDSVTVDTLAKRGVKKAEMEARGLSDLLADGKSARVSDLQGEAGQNRVEVREGHYAGEEWNQLDRNAISQEMFGQDHHRLGQRQADEVDRILNERQANKQQRGTKGPTRWSSYSLDPSNPTYRETVLHLPPVGKKVAATSDEAAARLADIEAQIEQATARGDNAEVARLEEIAADLDADLGQSVGRKAWGDTDFSSGHFSEPNIIAHARTSVQKDAQGNDVFVVNELQSDWGQKLRDGGVRDEGKIAELRDARDEAARQAEAQRAAVDGIAKDVHNFVSIHAPETFAKAGWSSNAATGGDILNIHATAKWAQEAYPEISNKIGREAASNWLAGVREGMALGLEKLRPLEQQHALRGAEFRTAEASTPGHPLVNTTDQWVNTALRRLIAQAVESGADQIAIPSGETIRAFKMGGKEEGISYAYDQMYPKNLRNILKKLDPSIESVKVDHLYSTSSEILDRYGRPQGGANPLARSKGFTTFKITDTVKRSVASEGLALFSLASSGRPTPPLTPEFEEALPDVVERLSKELQRMLPHDVAFRITDRLLKSGDLSELFGEYDPVARLLQVALFPRGVYDPVKAFQIARHETVHVLRMSGLFSTQEWELLVNHAKKVKIDDSITVVDEHGNVVPGIPVYRKAYADRLSANYVRRLREAGFFGENLYAALEDYSDSGTLERNVEELIDQERVAKMAETWLVGKATYGSKIEALLARIKKFFEALHNALAELGFQTADDVFQNVFSGEVAGRAKPTTVSLPGGMEIEGYAIKAFHGTPHTFTPEEGAPAGRFRAAKMGTGEGAQVFGRGLYFTESEKLGRLYQTRLSRGRNTPRLVVDGTPIEYFEAAREVLMDGPFDLTDRNDGEWVIGASAKIPEGWAARALAEWEGYLLRHSTLSIDYTKGGIEFIKQISGKTLSIQKPPENKGRLYEVKINAEEDRMLLWDQPLNKQPGPVRQALKSGLGNELGANWLNAIKALLSRGKKDSDHFAVTDRKSAGAYVAKGLKDDSQRVTDLLQKFGIQGIKYLDAASRKSGEGTFNYVVFDENLVEIVAVDGEPVTLASIGRISAPRSHGIPAQASVISSFTRDAEIKADPDYKSAKAGDQVAAARLVERLVSADLIQSAASRFGPDAIYVPVIAEEATGNNKIPEMLAHLFGISTGAQVSDDIVQSSRAFHTGARPLERLISRPRFDGPVEAGRRYVLVDDVSVMGGTLAELANHIVSNGGEVAGVVTLVNASRTGEIAPNAKDIAEIEKRYGSLVRDQLGIEPQALTGDEARYILNFRDADALGSSIAKARRERNERLRAKGLRTSEEDPEDGLTSIGRAKSTSDSLVGTTINVPAELFRWLGVEARQLTANYTHIAAKRIVSPAAGIDLTTPEAVRTYVEETLTNAMFAYRADPRTKYWDIVARHGRNDVVAVRLQESGKHYSVGTTLPMGNEQLARKLVASAVANGHDAVKWRDAPAASQILDLIEERSKTTSTLNGVERQGLEHPAVQNLIENLRRSQTEGGLTLASIASGGPLTLASIASVPSTPNLDMSKEARLARAEAMGFDTSRVWYHGTGAVFDHFEESGEFEALGPGVYVTEDPSVANVFAEARRALQFTHGSVIPLYARAKRLFVYDGDNLRGSIERADQIMPSGLVNPTKYHIGENPVAFVRALRKAGYDGIYHQWSESDGKRIQQTNIFDPRNIRSVNAAFDPAQENSPLLLASIGRVGSGTPVLSADSNRQDAARPESTLADLVKSVTRALGLTVRQGRIDPGLKRSAASRGNQVAGQFSQATGVTRLAVANDLATLAHEGGHALEVRPSIRIELEALKQSHVEELATTPAQNIPAPTLAPGQGFSGLELDAETQTLAHQAAEADITWRALAASVGAAKAGGGIVSAGTYDQAAYTAAQEEAAASRAALVRRLGRPTADAVIADITKAERPDMAAWIATRYSATGTPQPRLAVTASATELSEGFAEWFRVYVTNRREAASLAPRFMAAFEDMLGEAEPALLDTLSEIERQVDALTKASPIGALRSRVQSTVTPGMFQALREEVAEKGLGDTIGDRVYGFYHAFFDARHPMKRAVKFLLRTASENLGLDLQGKDRLLVKAIDDPYKLWRLSEHSKVHATAALQNGITNTKTGQVDPQGPSFWDALVAAFGGKSRSAWSDENAELFGSYLVARRMLAEFQRFDRGDLEQLPDQVISRDIWNRAKTQLEQKYPDFQAAASLLYAFNRNALKLKLDNGFLSQEVYDDLIQRPDYVPLNRIMDDGSPSALGTSARGTNKRRLIYKFQGSTRDFINPLESIVQDMYATQARIALNDVIRAMDRLARAAGPGGGVIAERIPAHEMKGTTVDLREAIKAAARSQNIAQSDKEGLLDIIDDLFDQDAAATIFRTTEVNEKGEPIVYLWEGGKKVPIRLGDNRIAKDIFDGFAAFGQDNQNIIVDVAALGTQALRAGITKAPAYILTNFLRDQIATWILSENFTPFATGARGMKNVVTNDQTAARYSAFAGLMGGVDANLIDTAAHKRDVLTLRRKGFSAVPAKSGIGQVWQTILRTMEITEAASRFGHFEAANQRALADGLTPVEAAIEAAYAAHDVMDFSRRGSKMTQVARIIAFLNASLQGLDVARRTISGERDSYANFREIVTPYLKGATGSPLTVAEKKALPNSTRFWMKAVGIGMAGVALAALYRDDEEYEEFDDQMRATHWFFKINGTWVRYPKPFELAFFSNLFEAGFGRMWKGNERALTQFLQSLRHTMIPPHEINVVKSYYEWQTGVDLFRGSKIVPTELGALPPEMQFTAYTSELGKLIGSIANLSPAQVDQVMGAMLGTVGRDIMRASDAALPRVNMLLDGALPGVSTEARAEKSFEDSWIVSRFTRRASRGSLSSRQFWNEMAQDGGKFIQAAEGYKNLRRAGDVRGARDLIDYLGDEEKAYAYLEGEFTEEEQDIHPLNRARQVLAVSSGIRKNLVLGRLFKEGTTPDARHKDREPEEIIVPPAKQTAVNEILEDISMREARNALVLIGEPGWAQRDILPVEPLLEELRKAAPDVAEEFEVRLTKGKNKIYPFEGVAKVWPLAKGRLIKDGPDADLTDLRIEAAHP